jgi:hypothetical protein
VSTAVALRSAALLLAALLGASGCASSGGPAKGSSTPATSGSGTAAPALSDPTLRSALIGLALGSAAGPIGSVVGAGIGYAHGLYAKREMRRQAEREAVRQKEIEQDLARQVGGSQGDGAPADPGVALVRDHLESMRRPAPLDTSGGQGVRIVEDHMAPARAVASRPESPSPAPRADAEGFVPVYAGTRLVRRERDTNGDGKPDVIVHLGEDGRPVRREESSQLDGRFDTVTHYRDGRIARRESDTDGDGQPDLRAEYDEQERPARTEALVAPGRKLVQEYADGRLAREEWRRLPEDRVETRLTYADGRVVEKEEDSTGSGVLDVVSVLDEQGRVVRQGRRTAEGRLAAWRYFAPEGGAVLREEELAPDGQVTAIAYYENGRLARRELYELDEALIMRTQPAPRVSEIDG